MENNFDDSHKKKFWIDYCFQIVGCTYVHPALIYVWVMADIFVASWEQISDAIAPQKRRLVHSFVPINCRLCWYKGLVIRRTSRPCDALWPRHQKSNINSSSMILIRVVWGEKFIRSSILLMICTKCGITLCI